MDPAVVFLDADGKLWLAAGHHRKEAYAQAGQPRMPCLVRHGPRWDAIRFGIEDNQRHQGERLSRADRQQQVKRVLELQPGLSDRAVAELCRVSASTVAKYRPTVQVGQSHSGLGRMGEFTTRQALGESRRQFPLRRRHRPWLLGRPHSPWRSRERGPRRSGQPKSRRSLSCSRRSP